MEGLKNESEDTYMNKRNWIILGLCALLLLIGGMTMIQKNFQTKDSDKVTKEQQITYLKEHEQEMTDYIKSQNSKVTSVQWDWDSIEVETIGNGTPHGGGTILTIAGGFNNIKDSNFTLGFELESANKYPNMSDMTMMQDLTIDGGAKPYE